MPRLLLIWRFWGGNRIRLRAATQQLRQHFQALEPLHQFTYISRLAAAIYARTAERTLIGTEKVVF
jgi:hypothetical protein